MSQNHRILSYANVEIYGPHNDSETIWPPLEGIAPEFEIFAGSIANGDWHCLTDFEYEFEVSRDYAKKWLQRLQLFGRYGVESYVSREPIAPKFFYLDKCELQPDLLFGPEVCKLLAAEFAENRDHFARFDWSKVPAVSAITDEDAESIRVYDFFGEAFRRASFGGAVLVV